MKAMVLCAGLGERLRPLTNIIPKPLVPAPGAPMVFHALDRLVSAGAELFVVNLHHLPEIVRETIGESYRGVPVEYSLEEEILGPTGGLRKSVRHFGGEPFIVVNGDVYSEVDCRAIYDFHNENGAALTMAVKTNSTDSKLNSIGFDDSLRVRQIWGKPEREGVAIRAGINVGVFVYSPEIIRRYVPAGGWHGFRDDFVPALFDADEMIFAFEYTGYWRDIGDQGSYLAFLRDALDGKISSATCGGGCVSENAVVDESANVIAPCFIAGGCEIKAGATVGPHVVMCENSTIGAGARVSDCMLAPGAAVAANELVQDKIILPL